MSELSTYKNMSVHEFRVLDEWLSWLEKNYDSAVSGVWLKIAKKGTGITTINYEDAREGGLCYGWIDSTPNKLDDIYYLLKMTPRRPRSIWSKINVELCEQYIADGRIKPSGQREIDRAKADGRWESAYSSPKDTVIPDDFLDALNANNKAKITFDSANKTNKFAFVFQVNGAKKPETRQRRIEKFVAMLERGEVLYDSSKKQ